MNDKVYISLDIVDGKAKQVAQALQGSLGVVHGRCSRGPPDAVIVMEAPNREQLAKLTNQTLVLVEPMTEYICLLPAGERLNIANSPKFSPVSGGRGKRRS